MNAILSLRTLRTVAARLHLARWVNALGIIGLFLFAFGVFFKDRTANAGIAMMATAFMLSFRKAGPGLLKDPLPIWGSLFFLFVCMQAASALIHFDGDPALILNRMVLYGCVFLLVFLIAFWVHQVDGQWQWVFLALVTGFLAQIIRKGEWANFFEVAPLYWTGLKRAGFGSPVNRFALWSAIVLLVCTLLHWRLWAGPGGKIPHGMRVISWGFMCAVSAMGVVFSKSRAAWLASAIVFPPIFFNRFCKTRRHRFRTMVLLAVVATSLAGLTNLPAIFCQRFSRILRPTRRLQKGLSSGGRTLFPIISKRSTNGFYCINFSSRNGGNGLHSAMVRGLLKFCLIGRRVNMRSYLDTTMCTILFGT